MINGTKMSIPYFSSNFPTPLRKYLSDVYVNPKDRKKWVKVSEVNRYQQFFRRLKNKDETIETKEHTSGRHEQEPFRFNAWVSKRV